MFFSFIKNHSAKYLQNKNAYRWPWRRYIPWNLRTFRRTLSCFGNWQLGCWWVAAKDDEGALCKPQDCFSMTPAFLGNCKYGMMWESSHPGNKMHCNLKQKRPLKDLYNPSAFAARYCKTGMRLACFSQWALIVFLSSNPPPSLRRNLRARFFTFCKFFVLIAERATPNLSCARVMDIRRYKVPLLHTLVSL